MIRALLSGLFAVLVFTCTAPVAVAAAGPTVQVEPRVEAAQPDETPKRAAAAQPDKPDLTVEYVLDKMEARRKTLKTLKADVVKLRQVELLDLTERYTGTIRFKMPRLVRLELLSVEDNRKTIYIVGKTYGWIYRPEDKQAERAKLADIDEKDRAGNPLEYGLAESVYKLKDAYTIKLLPTEKINGREVVPLELSPMEEDDYGIGRLILWINTRTWIITRVREFKSNGEIVETHTFSDIKVNERISDKVFNFKVPRDVEVILHDAE